MENLVGRRMAGLRLEKNFTQQALDKSLGISRSHIANFERGTYLPDDTIIKDYCRFFNVSSSYFKACDISENLKGKLKESYELLLHENYDTIELEKEFSPINDEQEMELKFLTAARFYSRREAEKAALIEKAFITPFLKVENFAIFSNFLQKCYQLYMIEKNTYEGLHDDAIAYFETLSALETNDINSIRLNLRKIVSMFRKQDYAKAYPLAVEAVKELEQNVNPTLLARAYIILSGLNNQLNIFQESLKVLKKLDQLTQEQNLLEERSFLYDHQGYIYLNSDLPELAAENYQKLLLLKIPQTRYIGALISNITCFIALKDYKRATELLEEMRSLPLNRREEMIFRSFHAETFLWKNNEKEFWKLQKEPLDYFLANNLFYNSSYVYGQIASYYFERKSYKQAADYLRKKERLIYEKNKMLFCSS